MPLIVPVLDEVCIVIKIKAQSGIKGCGVQVHTMGTLHENWPSAVRPHWPDGPCALSLPVAPPSRKMSSDVFTGHVTTIMWHGGTSVHQELTM